MYEFIKDRLNSCDYDFLRTNKHIGDRIILLSLCGSYVYGTNVESSDINIRGIALNSPDELLLSQDFNSVVNERTDTTIYSFIKIVKLLCNANPNSINL